MKKFRKLLALSWVDKNLFFQAALLVAFSTLCLRIFPCLKLQSVLVRLASRRSRRVNTGHPSIDQIDRAVRASSRPIPKASCLPQALATQHLLVANGYPADLQIGVARSKNGTLEAHAWVVTENQAILGEVRGRDRFVPFSNTHGPAIADTGKSRKTFIERLVPEARLLLFCARTKLSSTDLEQILALAENNIDWEFLVRLAFDHQVVPLVYRTLESVAPGRMPAAIRAKLKQHIQVSIQGNLSLTHELLQLLSLFDRHSIPVIPYKGPILAATVYHDLSVRSFGDLDILVHEEDILRAVDILVSSGYEIIRPNSMSRRNAVLHPYWINKMIHQSPWAYQVVLWNPARQGIVELHWRVTPRSFFSGSLESLWAELRPITLAGSTLFSLAPENLLWYLCLHGTKHNWTELRWVCDVTELLREYPELDWERVSTRAAELGLERRLYLGLFLSKNLMGVALPQEIEARMKTMPQASDLAKEVMDGLFIGAEQTTVFTYMQQLIFQLKAMDHMTDRVRYFMRFFKPLDTVLTAAIGSGHK
jgi:hypothetical protein